MIANGSKLANHSEATHEAYVAGLRLWSGCDWDTTITRGEPNLNGVSAAQARIIAMATAGLEARQWYTAAIWLREVEEVVEAAREAASCAMRAARDRQHEAAIAHANRAVELAVRYKRESVWLPLLRAIERLRPCVDE